MATKAGCARRSASCSAAWEAPQPIDVGDGAAEVVVDAAQVRVVLIARVDAMPRE